MKNLDMIKAFAKLEAVEIYSHDDEYFFTDDMKEYNPITDLALTMKAVIDYDVQITHSMVQKGKIIISIRGALDAVTIFCKRQTPQAIIECILKSKGLWHDN